MFWGLGYLLVLRKEKKKQKEQKEQNGQKGERTSERQSVLEDDFIIVAVSNNTEHVIVDVDVANPSPIAQENVVSL